MITAEYAEDAEVKDFKNQRGSQQHNFARQRHSLCIRRPLRFWFDFRARKRRGMIPRLCRENWFYLPPPKPADSICSRAESAVDPMPCTLSLKSSGLLAFSRAVSYVIRPCE